jgi:hypothetical protein
MSIKVSGGSFAPLIRGALAAIGFLTAGNAYCGSAEARDGFVHFSGKVEFAPHPLDTRIAIPSITLYPTGCYPFSPNPWCAYPYQPPAFVYAPEPSVTYSGTPTPPQAVVTSAMPPKPGVVTVEELPPLKCPKGTVTGTVAGRLVTLCRN